MEESLGKVSRPIWAQIEEKCFVKLGIERPYYHGGKYNTEAMVRFLNSGDKVMEEVKNLILHNIPSDTRCPDSEVVSATEMYADILIVFDSVFSPAQTPVGMLTAENEEKVQKRLLLAMKKWRELEMSITPKAHVLEDHFFPQLHRYKGLGF